MFVHKFPESERGASRAKNEATFSKEDIEKLDELERLTPILLASLHERIQTGTFGTIIGIDASGRLPALLLQEVIELLYMKRGFPSPQLHFLSGKIYTNQKLIEQLPSAIERLHIPKDRCVLVVDDTFGIGRSARPIIDELESQGNKVEFAVYNNPSSPSTLRAFRPGSHYATSTKVLGVYKSPQLSGVTTAYIDSTDHMYGQPYKRNSKVAATRARLHEIAKRAVAKYEEVFPLDT